MLPNLVVIGSMKCGTTSLHYYLDLHPEISMSREKELDFFLGKKRWRKGIDWYKSQFPNSNKIIGESSPNYTSYRQFPGTPARMYDLLPEAKLIYLVRHPIKRMVAHYIHKYGDGSEDRSLEEALINPGKKSYLDRSLYYTQISYYLDYYSPSQILILSSEQLRLRTQKSLRTIFEFLGVDTSYRSWLYVVQRHKSARKRRKTALGKRISESTVATTLKRIPPFIRRPLEEIVYFPFSQPIILPPLSQGVKSVLRIV